MRPTLRVAARLRWTVRSAGGGDSMEAVFWVRPVSPLADGSSIVISMSPQGGDRLSYFRVLNDLDANGGFQTKIIDYYDVHNTSAFRTYVAATGMSRTTWTKVRLVMETPDGSTNDLFKIYLNDQLVVKDKKVIFRPGRAPGVSVGGSS